MNATRRQPVTVALIAAVAGIFGIFLLQVTVGPGWTRTFGAIPVEIRAGAEQLAAGEFSPGALLEVSTVFTCTLMHGGIEHVAFNLAYLWIFGWLVMQALGVLWGLAIFVITGIAGSLTQCFFDWDSPIPIIGASGAVLGFEGAYLGLYLRYPLRDPDIWPIAYPIPPMNLLILTLFGVVADIGGILQQGQGIAYGAHLGGLVSGLFLTSFVVGKVRPEALR